MTTRSALTSTPIVVPVTSMCFRTVDICTSQYVLSHCRHRLRPCASQSILTAG